MLVLLWVLRLVFLFFICTHCIPKHVSHRFHCHIVNFFIQDRRRHIFLLSLFYHFLYSLILADKQNYLKWKACRILPLKFPSSHLDQILLPWFFFSSFLCISEHLYSVCQWPFSSFIFIFLSWNALFTKLRPSVFLLCPK